VNGSTVQVTENLHSALVLLAPRLKSQWIDTLCINQSDDGETFGQVQMTGSIYSQAVEVLVRLGPEGDGSSLAIRKLVKSRTRITSSASL